MSIDDEVSAAVETVAKAKIAEALGGDVVAKIIEEIMKQKGNQYGRSDAKTWFEQVVFDKVQNMIQQSVATHLATDEMKAKIAAAINIKSNEMATTIVDAFANDEWNAKLEIKIER